MKISDYIALKIKKLGFKNVPVFQGGAIMHIIDSIGNLKNLNYYCPYHEQSMAMGVDAYARVKGFGIGCVTSGPGATNLITGVCCAYYDSIPCLFFTGQVGQFHIKKNKFHRQKGFQETDVKRLFSSVTKFSYQVKDPYEIDYIIDKAIHIAKSGRPGPVVIDVPFNIQIADINIRKLKRYLPKNNEISKVKLKNLIDYLIENINIHKKTVFIAGGGVRLSKSEKKFLAFVKKLNIPFVTSWSAQDITQFDNPLYFGSIGRHGNQSANEVINHSDLVVTFGYRFTPKSINENFGKKNNVKIIAIDIDKIELNESIVKTDKKIVLDLKLLFNKLRKIKITKKDNRIWLQKCLNFKKHKFLNNLNDFSMTSKRYVNPYLFFHKLSSIVKPDTYIVTDAGANLCWCMTSFKVLKNQRVISAWGNSPMGYSIAAGIGLCYAENSKKKQIISSIGDGSFLINIQDLQFLKHHNEIKLKILVFDNQTLGNTKLGTYEAFNGRTHANDIEHGYYPPDIKKLTQSYGIKYFILQNNRNIEKKVKEFLSYDKTSILHIKVSKDYNVIDHSKKYLNSIYKF